GCERHLVLLLVRPLRRVRWLLVPGVVVVGFLVNVPVISQTSTAVCIGPVIVPLMRAAGYSMPTIGACLLLGASVGGELLNPGAPELLTVAKETGVSPIEQAHHYLPPLVFTQLAVSVAVVAAVAASPRRARDCVRHFCAGARYGFAKVVSLIVAATCFGEAIKTAGLAAALGNVIREAPGLMQPLAALVPLGFAAISGS